MRPDIFLATIGRGSNGSNALEVAEDRAAVTAESQDNIINRVNNVSQYGPSWHYVPGIGVAGTAYAEVPGSALGDLAFSRASSKTRTNSAGVVETIGNNVPPHDYRNADGTLSTFPRLNLEPQRTNLLTFSEQLDNADWSKTNVTISANATTSPSGTTSADKIVADSSAGDKIAFQVKTITTGQAFTISAFFKKSEYKLAFVRAGGQTAAPYVIYNLDTQAVVSTSGVSSTKIEHYGNGWYRVSLTLNSATSTTCAPNMLFLPDSGYTLNVLNIPSYTGDGTSGGFVWGCQLEANGSAYATSYIPTTTAAVTRLADAASKTGVSSLIGQTEGTLFAEVNLSNWLASNRVLAVSDGTTDNSVTLLTGPGANTFRLINRTAGALNVSIVSSTISGTNFKIAAGYANNDYVLYINGVQIGTDTIATVPACSIITAGKLESAANGNELSGGLAEAALFPTRLTNAQLAQLTTL